VSGLTQTLYANSAKRTTRKATTRACRMLIKRLLGCWVPLRAGAIHPLWKGEICNFQGTSAEPRQEQNPPALYSVYLTGQVA
jgi:hypothetical protein